MEQQNEKQILKNHKGTYHRHFQQIPQHQIINDNNNQNENIYQKQSQAVSEQFQLYQDFMKNINNININDHSQQFRASKIQYHPTYFVDQILLSIIQESKNLKIISFNVSFSYFTFFIRMYNQNGCSRATGILPIIGSGSFGKIYLIQHQNYGPYIIKNIPYSSSLKIDQIISKQIKISIFQYCLYKLASCLKIGPKVQEYFGFDLISYDNSIQFAMELCKKSKIQDINCLKQSLKLLHSLNITHGDIKKQNIMYSPSYDKDVLIDFNCSTLVPEEIGQKTITSFKGTMTYVIPEMQILFLSNIQGEVDLYYNDVFGLEKSFNTQDDQIYIHSIKNKEINYMQKISAICFYLHMKFRYYLWSQNFIEIYKFLKIHEKNLNVSQQIRQQAEEAKFLGQQDEEQNMYKFPESKLIMKISLTISETFDIIGQLKIRKNKQLGREYLQSIFGGAYEIQQKHKNRQQLKIMKEKYKSRFKQNIETEKQKKKLQEVYAQNILLLILSSPFKHQITKLSLQYLQDLGAVSSETQFIDKFFKLISNRCSNKILQKAIKLIESKGYIKFEFGAKTQQKIHAIYIKYKGQMLKCSRIYSLLSEQNYLRHNCHQNQQLKFNQQEIFELSHNQNNFHSILAIDFGLQKFKNYIELLEIRQKKSKRSHNKQYLVACKMFQEGLEQVSRNNNETSLKILHLLEKRILAQVPKQYQQPMLYIVQFEKIFKTSQKQYELKLEKLDYLETIFKNYGVSENIRRFCDYQRIYVYLEKNDWKKVKNILKEHKNKKILNYLQFNIIAICLQISEYLKEANPIDCQEFLKLFKTFQQISHKGMEYLYRILNMFNYTHYWIDSSLEIPKFLLMKISGFFMHIQALQYFPKEKIIFIHNFMQAFMHQYHSVFCCKNSIVLKRYKQFYKIQYQNTEKYPPKFFETMMFILFRLQQYQECLKYINQASKFYPNYKQTFSLAILRNFFLFQIYFQTSHNPTKPKQQTEQIMSQLLKYCKISEKGTLKILHIQEFDKIGQYLLNEPKLLCDILIKYSYSRLYTYLLHSMNSKQIFQLSDKMAKEILKRDDSQIVSLIEAYRWIFVELVSSLKYFLGNFEIIEQFFKIFWQNIDSQQNNLSLLFIINVNIILEFLTQCKAIQFFNSKDMRNMDKKCFHFIRRNIIRTPIMIQRRISEHYYHYCLMFISEILPYNNQRYILRWKLRQFRHPSYKKFSCYYRNIKQKIKTLIKYPSIKSTLNKKLRNIYENKRLSRKIQNIFNLPENLYEQLVKSQSKQSNYSNNYDLNSLKNKKQHGLGQIIKVQINKIEFKIQSFCGITGTLFYGIISSNKQKPLIEIICDGWAIYFNGIKVSNNACSQYMNEIQGFSCYCHGNGFNENDNLSLSLENGKLTWMITREIIGEYSHPHLDDPTFIWAAYCRNLCLMNQLKVGNKENP